MTTSKWTDKVSVETVMTTELNALTNADRNITATAISNDAAGEKHLYADFRIYLATQGSARSAGANVQMWIMPEVDGTYPYGDGTLDPDTGLLVGAFGFDAATTARYSVMRMVQLPPSDFHVILKNNTGQTLAATLNTLVMERYSLEAV
jgi:hypothetical protein